MKNISTNTLKIFSNTGNFKQHFYTNFGSEILKNKYILHWLYPFLYMEGKFLPQTNE